MKPTLENSFTTLVPLGNGVWQLTLFVPEVQHPLGWSHIVFYKSEDKTVCNIFHLEVREKARGIGVVEKMQNDIFEIHKVDMLISATGTKQGENKKRRLGWKQEPQTGLWYFNNPLKKGV